MTQTTTELLYKAVQMADDAQINDDGLVEFLELHERLAAGEPLPDQWNVTVEIRNEGLRELIGDFDAQKWAEAFCKIFPRHDLDTMRGWFANLIMAGYDSANQRDSIRDRDVVEKWTNSDSSIDVSMIALKTKTGHTLEFKAPTLDEAYHLAAEWVRGQMADPDYEVVVCSSCLTASCWHGEFMCQESQTANIKTMKARELRKLGIEHESNYSIEKLRLVTGREPKYV
jgi:hypothetical protein